MRLQGDKVKEREPITIWEKDKGNNNADDDFPPTREEIGSLLVGGRDTRSDNGIEEDLTGIPENWHVFFRISEIDKGDLRHWGRDKMVYWQSITSAMSDKVVRNEDHPYFYPTLVVMGAAAIVNIGSNPDVYKKFDPKMERLTYEELKIALNSWDSLLGIMPERGKNLLVVLKAIQEQLRRLNVYR